MSSLKLFKLLQDLVGRLNGIAVALRDEKLTSEEAGDKAVTLVQKFLDITNSSQKA